MTGSSKTITVENAEKLLELFVQGFAAEESPGLSLRVVSVAGRGEIRLEAQSQKSMLQVKPLLHASRKWLKGEIVPGDRPTVLLAPHVPEPLAVDLRQLGINHADLNGRLFLKAPGYLADRRPGVRRYRSPVTTPDVFSAKTSRLARALLARRDHVWTQEELTERTGLSRGLVSRVLTQLTEEDYVVREATATREAPARYRLSAFDRLLDAWKEADRWVQRTEVREFSVLTGDLAEVAAAARDILRDKEQRVRGVFTQWFAAHLRQPYTVPPVVSIYVRPGTELALPFARPVTHGGNLWLITPADDGVWQETQEVAGFPLVSDIQIYLDLLQVGQRGPEQALALRQWAGFAR